ncbi:tRNA (adenosine(37)-N6)-dimethylallyltransferase MiaA [Candidatus Saccharibacteria bacterium 32-50-13]|nr:MAG: tRNA (adenosine(37)-N6)-dimethylallyltransferase MiaA [Candidatus Saccharibacteria bacterium 32-50-13]
MATRMEQPEPPLVVIVGPTASGKTALAIRLAKRYDGEVICADSRTVYRDMDIGTAKPTPEEQADVPHWGLDMVDPGQRFTAADFKQYALRKVAEIKARGRIPFIVGGTGLYIDGVLFDYEFGEGYDPTRRSQLEALTIEKLYDYCHDNNITLPGNDRNKRYIIRAIEQESINKKRKTTPIEDTIVVGIATARNELRTRIQHRSEQMLANGVVDEAIILGKKYGWKNEAMTGNVYPLVKSYLEGQITYDDIKDKNTTLDWQLAKRQMTWFRRNPYIYWGDGEQIYRYVASVLEHKV